MQQSALPNNYLRMRDAMEREFLRYPQERMIRQFRLAHDREFLYLNFAGLPYRIHRASGRVSPAGGPERGGHADYNVSMTIFDVLCCASPGCRLAGRFEPIHSVKGVPRTAAVGSGLFAEAAGYFAGRCAELRDACEQLGGTPSDAAGDVSYRLPRFEFLPVILQFWDADEEFPAGLKWMWDENILDFMHFETTFFAANHLLERLKRLCSGG